MKFPLRRTLCVCAVTAALMASQASYAFSLSGFIDSLTGNDQAQKTSETIAQNPLASAVSKDLNITPTQAAGGIGALLASASSQLSGADAKQLGQIVPGMDALKKAIPEQLSALITPQTLDPIFTALGLNPKMIEQFVPTILGFVGQHGGNASLVQSLEKAWEPVAPQAVENADASSTLDSAKATLTNAEDTAKASLTNAETSTKSALTDAETSTKSALTDANDQAKSLLTNAQDSAKEAATNLKDSAKEAATNLKDAANNALNNLSDSLDSATKNLKDSADNATKN